MEVFSGPYFVVFLLLLLIYSFIYLFIYLFILQGERRWGKFELRHVIFQFYYVHKAWGGLKSSHEDSVFNGCHINRFSKLYWKSDFLKHPEKRFLPNQYVRDYSKAMYRLYPAYPHQRCRQDVYLHLRCLQDFCLPFFTY